MPFEHHTRSAAGWRPKKTAARVFVLWGQSNIQGYASLASLPAYLSGTIHHTYIWTGSAFAPLSQANCGYPQAGNDWGPELNLAYLAKERYTSEPVYIVKHGVGTTPLTATTDPTWNPNVSGSLYSAATAALTNALNLLTAQGRSPVVQGFVYGQGERDAFLGATRTTYATRLTELFNGVRALAGDNALPIADMLIYETDAARVTINQAKADVRAALGTITPVDANLLPHIGDNLHLNGAGQLSFGEQAFNIFR